MCLAVLAHRFPDIDIRHDVRSIRRLPRVHLLVAGFPCQPYSQAGPTPGFSAGRDLIKEIFRLLSTTKVLPSYVVLENVRNIIHLGKGAALRAITRDFERLGYTWAYRMVDTYAFGIPQRRERWLFVASLDGSAPDILFGDEPTAKFERSGIASAHGFYWTEGNRGLGWADDAIPPLKSGSTVGIPSPPAIWVRSIRSMVTPQIRDAERLQGFPLGWTDVPSSSDFKRFERYRWRMVGNAVSVPISKWIGDRIMAARSSCTIAGHFFAKTGPWPRAAWGRKGFRYALPFNSFKPRVSITPLLTFLSERPERLSLRATRGFRKRLQESSLRYPPAFMTDLLYHETQCF
jgi:DNA (cytosine-5)-methyltransferase 1